MALLLFLIWPCNQQELCDFTLDGFQICILLHFAYTTLYSANNWKQTL